MNIFINKFMDNRPTFFYNEDQTKPIRAGGVLIYNNNNLLMIKTNYNNIEKYEDIGGKSDEKDIDIYSMVAREVAEETNFKLDQEIIKHQIKSSKSIYIPIAKYVLFIVKANSYEKKLTIDDFGNKELFENIDRVINWITIDDFLHKKINLNPRLKSYELNEFLTNLT